jgi:phenylalanine-4-hydroxylase
MPQFLPPHLRKYVVEQNYEKYTPADQACWRYILRQLKSYLSKHAHESYVEGLEKTGISVEEIPHIAEISEKLQQFGWRALPVSGFIPPAAFMELQSLGVLPIASDMRSLAHLRYTPAPDIVHEAAGHAPILIQPEFAEYLRQYAQVAKKAILAKEDLDVYEAIRDLSDIKENPNSTPDEIAKAELRLQSANASVRTVSEAIELSRMNWWTAEYGLIGDLQNPKIFGAGLLSSVGESKWCLSSKVQKKLLTIECLQQTYDITEPQPQLYVTPDFKHLTKVLEEMASQMAFRQGGQKGLQKAIDARTVNTLQLDSGLQISGIIESYQESSDQIVFIKCSGPTQISFADQQLKGHHKEYHAHGYSSPLGPIKELGKALSQLSSAEINALPVGQKVDWHYDSGIHLTGTLKSVTQRNGYLLLLEFTDCSVQWKDQVLFAPDWGTFDLAAGDQVISVFGGPADRIAFGDTDDFVAKRVPAPAYTEEQKKIFSLYQKIRDFRKSKSQNFDQLKKLSEEAKQFPQEWLPLLEILEVSYQLEKKSDIEILNTDIKNQLRAFSKNHDEWADIIEDGLQIANQNL